MEDTTKIWGIRGISADVRQAVITQSQKQGMKAGEWLTVAILEKIRQDRNAGKALVVKLAVSAMKNYYHYQDVHNFIDS